jgi:virginiamycin A acetyltransferase
MWNNDVPHNVVCKGDIVIGNDVWICENVLIMSGVTIGDGAVIGANSIVTHDVEPYMIVVGCPAYPIKYRFADSTIHKLLKLKWWDLPDEEVKTIAPLLMSANIEELFKKYGL